MQAAGRHIEDLITRLSSEIEKASEVIERKRKRCDPEELSDLQFDVANKRERLSKLQTDSKQPRKRAKRHIYLVWRSTLRRQLGKNRNRAIIDRGAETAVYNVLYEQLKAHDRRWGDEGTGYLEGRRIQGKEFRRIANEYLKTRGLPLIKSKETVRSWGKPRNKRSRQASQHRGRGLWKSKRAEKDKSEVRVNVHYNRAHVKTTQG